MQNLHQTILTLVAACAIPFLAACSPNRTPQTISGTDGSSSAQPGKPSCDCSLFPPKRGCDSQCGITIGIIDNMTADSVTISIPSISVTADGHKSPQITERTFSIGPAEAQQLQSIKQGSRVALTFHQQTGRSTLSSIRELPPVPSN